MELNQLMEHFRRLYGRRNRIFLQSLRDRIDFLNIGIGDLQEAVRKQMSSVTLETALARVVARIACIVEHFEGLPLRASMLKKYPLYGCSYCTHFPCSCKERRPEPTICLPDPKQFTWTLAQWCEHFNAVYGDRNRARGIENVMNRLFKEVSELLSLAMRGNSVSIPTTQDEIEREFSFELADALAWTIAVANIYRTNLERVVLDRYGNGCWKCRKSRCECTSFNIKPIHWESDT